MRLKVACLSLVGFFLLSTNVVSGLFYPVEGGSGEGQDVASFLDPSALVDVPTMVSADGFMVKPTMQASAGERKGISETLQYTVSSGDTISEIAYKFDLNPSTVLFANNLTEKSTLKVGQNLIIPPVDGLVYKVGASETLPKIADKFKIDKNDIIAQNKLSGETVVPGTTLIIPGAKPVIIAPTIIADAGNDKGKSSKTTGKTATSKKKPVYASLSTSVPQNIKTVTDTVEDDDNSSSCQGFAWPVSGGSKVTQSFRAGHPALDIQSNSKQAPIVAARAGVVIEAHNDGAFHGGYGNVIVIDHGNGIKTRYAHNSKVFVSVGDHVGRGQQIAIEGHTGRVYGATGIHSHFEVMINGKKVNPRICY